MVREVFYEVRMTRVLHTARVTDVVRFMFVNRIRERIRARNPKVGGLIPRGNSEFFLCPILVTRRKHLSVSVINFNKDMKSMLCQRIHIF